MLRLTHLILVALMVQFMSAQMIIGASPATHNAFVQETTIIELDPDLNSFGGAEGVASFTVAVNSPDNPSYVSNDGFNIAVLNPPLADVGTDFTIYYNVDQIDNGVCNPLDHIRRVTIRISKRTPEIQYQIPNQEINAGRPFEFTFPQEPGYDTYGTDLTYFLTKQDGTSLNVNINLDIENLRIHGEVDNTGSTQSFLLTLRGSDIVNQNKEIDFILTAYPNRAPQQVITDLTPYTVVVREGMSYDYVIPFGIYSDPDGDTIYYDTGGFTNFNSMETSWSTFISGQQGVAKFQFTNAQTTDYTSFFCMITDNNGLFVGPLSIPLEVNLRPVVTSSQFEHSVFPNDTFSWEVDLTTMFEDPESDTLTFTFDNLPGLTTATLVSGSIYRFESDFVSAFSGGNSQTFRITADDGVSLPTSTDVTLNLGTCADECSKCYGSLNSECYECSAGNFLDSSTCLNPCPDGKYGDDGICYECHEYGEECTGAGVSNCQVGTDSYFLKGPSTCVDDCGIGFFGYQGQCYEGAEGGRSCSGELHSECHAGKDFYVWTPEACVMPECLDHQYLRNDAQCIDCHVSCSSCTGETSSDGVDCALGYEKNNGRGVSLESF